MAKNENSDFTLNTGYFDLSITAGDFTITQSSNATAQRLALRLRSFQGDSFLNPDFGINYYGDILVKNPDLLIVQSAFVDQIAAVPRITGITEFNLEFEPSIQHLDIDFKVTTQDGSIEENITI